MADHLATTDLAEPVIYQPQDRNDVEVRALVGRPENEGDLGRVRVQQSTVRIEVRVTALDRPLRRDRFELRGVIYAVAGDGQIDESGAWWLITGNKVSDAA